MLPPHNPTNADIYSPAPPRRTFPPMLTPPDKMDAILAGLTPREVPEFRRAIDLFEHAGVIAPA